MKKVYKPITILWKIIKNPTILISLFALIVFTIFFSSFLIEKSAKGKLYNNVNLVPHNKAGLLLGTSKYVSGGQLNAYYQNRINAAVLLFNAKKIDYIIVSGDNRHRSYNEPKQMQKSLIKHNIPKNKIILDYAGFRTLDSVIRAKEVFGQDSYTVISQPFHNKRAIFIANKKGYNVIGFNAKKVIGKISLKTKIREKMAKVKAVLDIYILNKKPKFLGEPINIEEPVVINLESSP